MRVHIDTRIDLSADEHVTDEDLVRIKAELHRLAYESQQVIDKMLQKDDPIKAFERARVL